MRSILLKSFALAAALLGFAACQTNAADIQILGVTNSIWHFTNCAAIGSPSIAIPTISAVGYDDSAWAQGRGLFGVETTPEEYHYPGVTTLIPFNTPIPNPGAGGAIVTYLRTKFTWSSGDPTFVTLHTTNYVDDGVVYYLNGVEVARSRVPAGDDCTTLGSNPPTEGDPVANSDIFDLLGGHLVSGENVLVAELRQSSTGSSDDVFGMSLTAILPFAVTNAAPLQPTNRTILQFRSSVLTVSAVGSPAPTYQWFEDGLEIFGATGSSLTLTNPTPDTSTKSYFCHVSNPLGSFDSRTAVVTYTSDTVPPTVLGVSQAGAFNSVVVSFSEVMDMSPSGGTADPFNYEVFDAQDIPLGVNSATPSADGASIILELATPMAENSLYTADIGGVGILDLAQNQLTPVRVSFRSWVSNPDCSGVVFEVYDTSSTAGNTVALLTSHPNFPNNPRETFHLTTFTTREAYPDDSHEQYGGRLRSVFVPPTSGNWIFYLRSDDSSELYLNPTGPGAAGKVLIQAETGCCNGYALHTSAPQALTAGQGYYIEALYKEGTGGDFCQVAAAPQGAPVPPDGESIPGSMLGSPASPAGVAGTFTITQQPASQSVVAQTVATFSVGTSSDVPKCYQWYRDGVAIAGAQGSQYSLTAATGDNGAKFSVRISMVGVPSQLSTEATLSVGADTTSPTVVSVAADAAGTSLTVTFSEPVGPSGAIANNYTINGTPASSATLDASARVATVVPASPLQGGGCTLFQVSISGVRDQAASPNLLSPNPTTVSLSVPTVEILAMDHVWKYSDTATDLGTSWSATGFDDSAWPSGPAPLGFELALPAAQHPLIATPIGATTATNTAYFRTHFNLAVAPSAILTLQLSEVIDDGGVYYFNGVEVHRSYMAAGVINFSTLTTGGGPEPVDGTHTTNTFTIPTTGLVAGDNVLAVELHPSSVTSSDSEFAAQLSIVLCRPSLTIQHVGSQVRLTWSDAAYHLETAPTPDGAWTAQAGGSGLTLTSSAGNAFFRLVTP